MLALGIVGVILLVGGLLAYSNKVFGYVDGGDNNFIEILCTVIGAVCLYLSIVL